MSGHTPGPWAVGTHTGYGDIDGVLVEDTNSGLVVAIALVDVEELPGDANARLIAAAPEMLEALEQALRYIEADECAHGRQFGDGNVVRAAIAKATKK